MRSLIYLFAILIIQGCCSKANVTDYGLLSDELKAMVPYEDGKFYRFKHSGGHIVNFTCDRKAYIKEELGEEWFGCWQSIYEEEYTQLNPDYPIENFSIRKY